jgi:hypothetical protein
VARVVGVNLSVVLPCLRVCIHHHTVCLCPYHFAHRYYSCLFLFQIALSRTHAASSQDFHMKKNRNLGKITLDTAVCSNDDLAKAVASINQVQEERKKLDEGLVQVCYAGGRGRSFPSVFSGRLRLSLQNTSCFEVICHATRLRDPHAPHALVFFEQCMTIMQ